MEELSDRKILPMPATPLLYITLGAITLSAIAVAFIKFSIWLENRAGPDDWHQEWDEA